MSWGIVRLRTQAAQNMLKHIVAICCFAVTLSWSADIGGNAKPGPDTVRGILKVFFLLLVSFWVKTTGGLSSVPLLSFTSSEGVAESLVSVSLASWCSDHSQGQQEPLVVKAKILQFEQHLHIKSGAATSCMMISCKHACEAAKTKNLPLAYSLGQCRCWSMVSMTLICSFVLASWCSSNHSQGQQEAILASNANPVSIWVASLQPQQCCYNGELTACLGTCKDTDFAICMQFGTTHLLQYGLSTNKCFIHE